MNGDQRPLARAASALGDHPAVNAHILVVDDDPFQQELICEQLRCLGYQRLLLADSGTSALAVYDARRQDIGLVISDLSMPDMDGLVLMRHFARRQLDAALILSSGVSDEILNSAAGLASAHQLKLLGVLSKPFQQEALGALLSHLDRPLRRPARGHEQQLSKEHLQAALARKAFLSWYQPKIDLRTGRVHAVEALARWPQPDGSMVGPGEFVPALEDAGLADALFFSIAAQGIEAIRNWRALGLQLQVAINMSMDTALNLEVPEQLLALVQEGGITPGDLIIEVTESRLMVERSLAMESLTRLSLMGFKLSIDDFDTGYSSLVQLVDLPFRELKIDGGFVQRSSLEAKAKTILRISALLGQNLNMDVVAEGVETLEQLNYVRECGCDTVQGYYFSPPLPWPKLTRWLQQREQP